MRQLRERRLQQRKQHRRHHQPKAVHRQVMVHAVHEEVQHERERVVRQVVVEVEEEAVEKVLEERPDDVANHEADAGLEERGRGQAGERGHREARVRREGGDGARELEDGAQAEVRGNGQPDDGE